MTCVHNGHEEDRQSGGGKGERAGRYFHINDTMTTTAFSDLAAEREHHCCQPSVHIVRVQTDPDCHERRRHVRHRLQPQPQPPPAHGRGQHRPAVIVVVCIVLLYEPVLAAKGPDGREVVQRLAEVREDRLRATTAVNFEYGDAVRSRREERGSLSLRSSSASSARGPTAGTAQAESSG